MRGEGSTCCGCSPAPPLLQGLGHRSAPSDKIFPALTHSPRPEEKVLECPISSEIRGKKKNQPTQRGKGEKGIFLESRFAKGQEKNTETNPKKAPRELKLSLKPVGWEPAGFKAGIEGFLEPGWFQLSWKRRRAQEPRGVPLIWAPEHP